MKTLKLKIAQATLLLLFAFVGTQSAFAQCETWEAYPDGVTEARKQHVIYKDRFEAQRYEEAYPIWEKLFQYVKVPVPAKTTHFLDGATMCFHFAGKETDADKKIEWIEKAIDLYDQNAGCNGETSVDRAYQAYYMYANQYNTAKTLDVYKKSLELGKDKAPAMIVDPLARLSTYAFTQKMEGYDDTYLRKLYNQLKELCEKNIKAGNDAESYKTAWTAVEALYAAPTIEPYVFGCDYWEKKLQPEYDQLAKGERTEEVANRLYEMASKLTTKCGKENELYKKCFELYREIMRELKVIGLEGIINDENVPAIEKINALKKLATYFDGEEAEKYTEKKWEFYPAAIDDKDADIDNEERGNMAYRYAYRLYKNNNDYGGARKYCRKASQYRPNWGEPYLLVGSMYASSSSSCGGKFDGRDCIWVAIDEWAKARSVDGNAAGKANKLIGQYSASMPSKTKLFQMGVNEGSKHTVGCWIGQSTTVRGSK